MAKIMRVLFGIIFSAIVSRFVNSLFNQAANESLEGKKRHQTVPPALDLKKCPQCGLYTSQPCPHCAR